MGGKHRAGRWAAIVVAVLAAWALAAPAAAQTPLIDAFPLEPAERAEPSPAPPPSATTAAPPAPAAAPVPGAAADTSSDGGSPPLILWLVVGALAVGTGVTVGWRYRHPRAPRPAATPAPAPTTAPAPAAPTAPAATATPAATAAPAGPAPAPAARAPHRPSAYEITPVDAGRDELDMALLEGYARSLGQRDPMLLLQARGLLTRQGRLTAGALLLFGINPQERFPEATVRVVTYAGSERGSGSRQAIVGDLRAEGPLPSVLRAAMEEVDRRGPGRVALGAAGLFEEHDGVPRDAWVEGLVNAVIHRSYEAVGDCVRVELLDDAIVVESPGRFPDRVDPNDPQAATRYARNPRIARVCSDMRFGQELGEGVRRIFEEMRLAGLEPPRYRQTAGSVILSMTTQAAEGATAVAPAPRDMLTALTTAGRVGTGELARALGVPRAVALRHLKSLQEQGLVEWIGRSPSDPRAYWRKAR